MVGLIMETNIRKLLEDIPLKTRLKVLNEMAFIDLITELGYREEKMWSDEEDELLSKLCKLALKHTENILEEIEEVNSNKLKMAKKALEFYERYSKDSRNFGLISTKIEEALKVINE